MQRIPTGAPPSPPTDTPSSQIREFCETLDHEEMIFVFAHEVIHCMFGHTDRRGDRDPLLWNYAIDYATNLMLQDFGMKMPKVGLLDHKYRNMTAEDIYESLVKDSPPQNIQYAESGNIVLSNKKPLRYTPQPG